jgi:small subunit ribosomal protein S21
LATDLLEARDSEGLVASRIPTFFGISERHQKERRVQVLVRDNNVDQALKALKKKMQREGIFREMKLRGHYEKPSEKKAREKAEAVRRARKLARKRAQREGLIPMKAKPAFGAPGGQGGPGGSRGGPARGGPGRSAGFGAGGFGGGFGR